MHYAVAQGMLANNVFIHFSCTSMRILTTVGACLWFSLAFSEAAPKPSAALLHPFYVGVTAGYGSTTWQGLVPSDANKNEAMSISTPISVTEGGGVWGGFAGYELNPYFALEAHYMHYPNARVSFDEFSLFAFETEGLLDLHTQTETISVLAKVMLMVPRTTVRVYSAAGIAETHRRDELTDSKIFTPTFGIGVNYNLTEHLLGELGANYTAGYGDSELNPANDYVPFLYAGFVRLAYRI